MELASNFDEFIGSLTAHGLKKRVSAYSPRPTASS